MYDSGKVMIWITQEGVIYNQKKFAEAGIPALEDDDQKLAGAIFLTRYPLVWFAQWAVGLDKFIQVGGAD